MTLNQILETVVKVSLISVSAACTLFVLVIVVGAITHIIREVLGK